MTIKRPGRTWLARLFHLFAYVDSTWMHHRGNLAPFAAHARSTHDQDQPPPRPPARGQINGPHRETSHSRPTPAAHVDRTECGRRACGGQRRRFVTFRESMAKTHTARTTSPHCITTTPPPPPPSSASPPYPC
ncbi:hypothetical protein B0J12DRAFT_139374 [Macrophomina phaseolina]|uniref:Uncharacterized protein n=1 Tax=Macrophomina phaseolina TaxID=35725 RepID=A0ABQ8G799_9PEZI|nr:hypothetical protein B0J12DRAFT_139374 [Macrophomina phaseolina]